MTAYYEDSEPQHTAAYLWAKALAQLPGPPARILEIGCGNGAFARRLVGLGYTVVAFDPSETGVSLARQGQPPIDAVTMSVTDALPEAWRAAFDAVISLEVIEHLYEPAVLPRKAFWALKPGGAFVLSTPYHGYVKYLILALTGRSACHFDPLWDGGHIKFFTPESLRRVLTNAGLQRVCLTFAGRAPLLWKSMIACAHKPL